MSAFSIHSEINSTQSNLISLFLFISDFKNFNSILPEDRIEDFKFSELECSFNIKGIMSMKIKIIEKHAHDYILFASDGLANFNFNLKVFFIGEANQNGECKIELYGDLNPFIKSMAEKSLIQLVNTMSLKLSQLKLESI
jgi:hypothetical protein